MKFLEKNILFFSKVKYGSQFKSFLCSSRGYLQKKTRGLPEFLYDELFTIIRSECR